MENEIKALDIFLDAPGHTIVVKLVNGREFYYNMTEIIKTISEYNPLDDESLFESGLLQDNQVIWKNGEISFGVLDIVYGGNEIEGDE